ncbi:MAG: hypothetical protein QW687_02885 [Candidatus Hadarchaeales archaeon]
MYVPLTVEVKVVLSVSVGLTEWVGETEELNVTLIVSGTET